MRLCRAKSTGEIFAMKKLKKSEMLSRGQVPVARLSALYVNALIDLDNRTSYCMKQAKFTIKVLENALSL